MSFLLLFAFGTLAHTCSAGALGIYGYQNRQLHAKDNHGATDDDVDHLVEHFLAVLYIQNGGGGSFQVPSPNGRQIDDVSYGGKAPRLRPSASSYSERPYLMDPNSTVPLVRGGGWPKNGK